MVLPPHTVVAPAVIKRSGRKGVSIELGTPFAVSTDDMLEVVGAFEAAIESIKVGAPVAVRRD